MTNIFILYFITFLYDFRIQYVKTVISLPASCSLLQNKSRSFVWPVLHLIEIGRWSPYEIHLIGRLYLTKQMIHKPSQYDGLV